MSHTVHIKTQITDKTALLAACEELKLECTKGTTRLYQDQEHTGMIVKLPGWFYPVVIDTKTGSIAYDNSNGQWGKIEQLNKLTQLYAVHKATIEAKKRGYIVRRVAGKNGAINLNITGV